MRRFIRFNPFGPSPAGAAQEIAELAAAVPELGIELQLCAPRPNEFALSVPVPTATELGNLRAILDAAGSLGVPVWLSVGHYAHTTPSQNPLHIADHQAGETVPADPSRTFPWDVPACPEANLDALLDWWGVFLGAVGRHPALDTVWLRGQSLLPFAGELKGDSGATTRDQVATLFLDLIPALRWLTTARIGLHVQPEFWRAPADLSGLGAAEGPCWWAGKLLESPQLAGVALAVTVGRRIPVGAALEALGAVGYPAHLTVLHDFKLYHAQTAAIYGTDPYGYLASELSAAEVAGAYGATYWQYRPEGQATTHTLRDAGGGWNEPLALGLSG